MLELFPHGFEEVDDHGGVELVAYTDAAGEERLWHTFGGARAEDVAADWRDRWKAFHQPVRVGDLWIGPPWEAAGGAHDVDLICGFTTEEYRGQVRTLPPDGFDLEASLV